MDQILNSAETANEKLIRQVWLYVRISNYRCHSQKEGLCLTIEDMEKALDQVANEVI